MKEKTTYIITVEYSDGKKVEYKATGSSMSLEGRSIDITLENGDHVIINFNDNLKTISTPKEGFPVPQNPLNSKAESEIDEKIKEDKKEWSL